MELRQLVYFVQIVKDGTYSAAAKTLFISQPALSKSIKQLEEELGATLFNRNEKRGELTEVGQVLFERAQIILKEYHATLDAINEISQFRKERLRIGIPHGLGQLMFYRLVSEFAGCNPDIEIIMSGHGSHHIQQEILEGKLDIGATIIPPALISGLEGTGLINEVYFLLVPREHPLAQRQSVRFADLEQEQLIMLNDEFALTTMTKSRCVAAGFSPRVKLVTDRAEVAYGLVADGFGILVLAGGQYRFADNNRLCCVPIDDSQSEFQIALVAVKKQDQSSITKKFIEFSREYLTHNYDLRL